MSPFLDNQQPSLRATTLIVHQEQQAHENSSIKSILAQDSLAPPTLSSCCCK